MSFLFDCFANAKCFDDILLFLQLIGERILKEIHVRDTLHIIHWLNNLPFSGEQCL